MLRPWKRHVSNEKVLIKIKIKMPHTKNQKRTIEMSRILSRKEDLKNLTHTQHILKDREKQ